MNPMMDQKKSPSIEQSMESMSERLSNLETLYFPRALQSAATTPSDRKSLLLDLLSRDAAVFLERYGSQLTSDELNELSVLNDDYEINWHLNHLRSLISPTADELKSKSAQIKNRRLAYMDKLVIAGHYFSEDAMREREPYLHHEYVGKFQDPSGRNMARPGEKWSETLMRRSEEAILVAKIRGEQQRLGVAECDWVGNEIEQPEEEEEEEEEEDEDEDEEEFGAVGSSHPSQAVVNKSAQTATEEEMQDQMNQLTVIMQQKFLSGEDHQHLDYTKIDEDETLDDCWQRGANHDAEEKYFGTD
ncbi:coiled-coil domain-containing protein 97 [Impatiens glandulifera]|uniref:coiled-coil domain-containing protein 97 n=1 Tax=Impatiens glandulifera TaxID=253017 RepID=UPI001FB16C92|nr:coiled-coil domain-containing protein 97 [Impatiens glandulifera]